MARLALVTPPVSGAQRYGRLAPAGSYVAPLGVCYLAASARAAGHAVRIFDLAAGVDPKVSLAELLRWQPSVVGITATTMAVHAAADVARCLKETLSVPVVIGGVHVTALPQQTMELFPHFDLGVLGEGEQTLVELLDALDAGRDTAEIRGLIARRRDGTLLVTPERDMLMDLDRLPPPAWDLLDGFPHRYRPQLPSVKRLPTASIIASRGCPYRCSFCYRGVTGHRVRLHSPEYILKMVEDLYYNFGVRAIQFEDDIFTLNRAHVRAVCSALRQSGMNLVWSCLARVDGVDEATLRAMKDAGCWCVMFGMESGDAEVLRLIDKRITPDMMRSAVELCRKVGLRAKGFFMVGAPGETTETLRRTEVLMLELGLSDVGITSFTPFPGAQIYREWDRWGTFRDDWRSTNCYNVVFVPTGLTPNEIRNATRRMYRRFYLRPRIIADYAARITSPRHAWEFARAALTLFQADR